MNVCLCECTCVCTIIIDLLKGTTVEVLKIPQTFLRCTTQKCEPHASSMYSFGDIVE